MAQHRRNKGFTRRLLTSTAVVLALAACGEDAPIQESSRPTVGGARLTVPTHLTPPVRVEMVEGTPGGWNLNQRVAQSLRQRDVPAGTTATGNATYVLRGRARPGESSNASRQLVVEWALYDPEGNQVGSVSQIAAIPNGQEGGPNEDVVDAIADAAAESISPIIPSANVAHDTMTATGEPPENNRRQIEGRNPVTAIGRMGASGTGVSRNLIGRGGDNQSAEATGAEDGQEDNAGAATAVGRMSNRSALSRNLMERDAGTQNGAEASGEQTGEGTTVTGRPGDSFASGTTSSRGDRDARDYRQTAEAGGDERDPEGTMEELFREDTYNGERPAANGETERPAGNGERGTSSARTDRAQDGTQAEAGEGEQVQDPRRALDTRQAENRGDGTEAIENERRSAARTGNEEAQSGRQMYWVQIGSFRTEEEGQRRWDAAKSQAPEHLGAAEHRVVAAEIEGRGTWHRLQVGPIGEAGAARQLCGQLRTQHIDCFVTRARTGEGAYRVENRSTRETRPNRQQAQAARNGETQRETAQERTENRREIDPATQAERRVRVESTAGPEAEDGAPITTSPGIPGITLD